MRADLGSGGDHRAECAFRADARADAGDFLHGADDPDDSEQLHPEDREQVQLFPICTLASGVG